MAMWVIVLAICTLFAGVHNQEQDDGLLHPVVPNVRKTQVIEGNGYATLCNNTIMPEAPTFWTHNVTGSTFFQNSSLLEILDMTRWQKGQYVCSALNETMDENGTVSTTNVTVDSLTIEILYPCDVIYFNTPARVNENETFTMACGVWAYPEPTYSLRNLDTGQGLMEATLSSNFTLSNKARCEDGGTYACTGYNYFSYGKNATKLQTMEVMCKPRPDGRHYSYENQSIRARTGSNQNLTLYVQGYPFPNFYWVFNDTVVPKSGPKSEQYDGHINDTLITTLTLKNLETSDFGKYLMFAQNSVGTGGAAVHLEPFSPEPPSNLQLFFGTYDSVSLRFTSGYSYNRTQVFYVRYFVKPRGQHPYFISFPLCNSTKDDRKENVSFILTSLSQDLDYNITVYAQFLEDSPFDEYESRPSNVVHYHTKVQPYPHPAKTTDNTRVNLGIILGASSGGLLLIAVAAVLVYVFKYRHRRRSKYITMKELTTVNKQENKRSIHDQNEWRKTDKSIN